MLLFRLLALAIFLFLLAPGFLLFFDALQASFFLLLEDLASIAFLLLDGAEALLLLKLEPLESHRLLVLQLLHAGLLLLRELAEPLLLLLLEPGLALGLFLLETGLGPVLLAPHPLEALLLLLLEACLALGLLCEQLLLVKALLFFKALPTSIVFSVALLTSLLLEPESLLTIVLLLGQLALSLKLVGLSLEPLFLLLSGSLLFSSLGGQHTPFSGFLLESKSFSLFLFLPHLLLSLQLLFTQFQLFFISLRLQTLRFFKFTLVHFGKLSGDHGLMLLFFFLKTGLLLFQSLATRSILSFVFESVSLVEGSQFLLPAGLISFRLEPRLLLLFGEAGPGSLKLSHAVKLLTLLDQSESLFFFSGLATGFLLCGLGLQSEPFSFCKFGAALSLSLLLLSSLFLNFQAESLLFFFLFFDDGQVVLVFIFIFS